MRKSQVMLNPHYRDMLACLTKRKVAFLLVGAYAMGAHGHPRATGDIDLWVNPTATNAKRVLAALKDFGAPLGDLTLADLARDDTVFQCGQPPTRIDILTGIDGIDFPSAWESHITKTLDGVTLPVISIADLIRNKTAAGRDQDKLDVKILNRRKKS